MSQSQTSLFTLADGQYQPASVEAVVAIARECIDAQFAREATFDSPGVVKSYLSLRMGSLEREVFAVVFLDSQNRVIESREMFFGSISQTSVYPREVAKAALSLNAAAVILAHNHPSGVPEPSRADEILTQSLKSTLALLEIRVLDHFLLAGGRCVSFAERGLL
jgi:DNA repair protein RadC